MTVPKLSVLLCAAALCLSVAGAAPAQVLRPAPPPDPQPIKLKANGEPVDPGDVMECRQETGTGSRIKGTTCRTKREWAIREGNARDFIKTVQDKAVGCPACQ